MPKLRERESEIESFGTNERCFAPRPWAQVRLMCKPNTDLRNRALDQVLVAQVARCYIFTFNHKIVQN